MKIVPTEKQNEFLKSDADILLGGGGAGGGKSFVLLLDALGLNDKNGPRISLPHYRALIYRKQYKHLLELIDKSKQLYPKIDTGAEYNNSTQTWKFSSGATLIFAYFENIQGVEQIQGRELQYIGCDEIGLYESPKVMEFCLSRLRSAHGLKCYYRATSNPSKYKWLRTYFDINPLGESTRKVIEHTLSDGSKVKKVIQYIQFKMQDNPHIPKEYEASLQLLSEQDRLAFLEGRWDSYDVQDGAIYTNELREMYCNFRFCNIPIQKGADIFASFDLGRNDTTAVIIFQIIGKERHIIESFEDSFKDITYYIDILKQKFGKDIHIILPHDSKQHRIETKNSVYDTISETFSNVTVIPKYSIEDGIDNARRNFHNVYIDKNKNLRLVECLTCYRRKYNAFLNVYDTPIHDEYSNFADSFRYMMFFDKPEVVKIDIEKMLNFAYTL